MILECGSLLLRAWRRWDAQLKQFAVTNVQFKLEIPNNLLCVSLRDFMIEIEILTELHIVLKVRRNILFAFVSFCSFLSFLFSAVLDALDAKHAETPATVEALLYLAKHCMNKVGVFFSNLSSVVF